MRTIMFEPQIEAKYHATACSLPHSPRWDGDKNGKKGKFHRLR